MRCSHCLSSQTVKNGQDDKGIQRYKCNECKRRFCEKGFFARYKHTSWQIVNVVYLRLHRLSLRETSNVSERLIYVHVSHVTIYNWCMKFINLLMMWASLFFLADSSLIHIDEKFIKVRGSKDSFAYLFVALGTDGKIRATYLANSRTKESAIKLFKRLANVNKTEIAVTDKCQIYVKTVKELGRKVRHVKAHFKPVGIVHKHKLMKISNNRIERLNSDIDLFLHVFRGLKSFKTAEIWLNGFVIYHNWLKPSRISWHKIHRQVLYSRKIKTNSFFVYEFIAFSVNRILF